MKIARPINMVPNELASITPNRPGYGMFNAWDTQDCAGSFAQLDGDGIEEEEEEIFNPDEGIFLPFPRGLGTKHRFPFFGSSNL
ncbi:hypothetical protein HN958_03270 [Candidatus Falkowbacteria bacterium]|nr:hypothetical protein [Candidatus Falkowbacteria bacterium]MBT7007497.1 hypothetical protein [Candidatus Falkowbacteria bacterium]